MKFVWKSCLEIPMQVAVFLMLHPSIYFPSPSVVVLSLLHHFTQCKSEKFSGASIPPDSAQLLPL